MARTLVFCVASRITLLPTGQVHSPGRQEFFIVFVLDSRLQQDTLPIGDFPLCRLLLSNDTHYPWFILVPRRADITEVFQLSAADQLQLWQETTALSKVLKEVFVADKINVAALGNVVSQLHMHVIARKRDDIAWPAPVWGKHAAVAYSDEQFAEICRQLKPALTNDFRFEGERP
ncbi:Histidine triad protein [Pseudomonas syringae pv. antirrhini]|uniref:Histidine triad protein n=3 Tax=Pseudomonas syringae group genomosp. 3 TaxID=251701 RepID=A0A3M5RGR8_9PSED|nr:Histidine triad family protein [Pseudomonas syringae pv. antirrhini]RMR36946.1 Histidine triad protein [Pseudomonas syringae pv. coriandricola]RMU08130.1 Histidine triad protein [Pseudomonas syringae pv. coriandricola]RMW29721.1 Histidine triad protein [Pseudomonas syringae pv. antirrhini]